MTPMQAPDAPITGTEKMPSKTSAGARYASAPTTIAPKYVSTNRRVPTSASSIVPKKYSISMFCRTWPMPFTSCRKP
jgi:hypothetical protein